MANFNLTDKDLDVVKKVFTNVLSKNGYGDFLNMGVDLHIVLAIRDDIEEYFDHMESRSGDQVLMDNIHLGME